MGLRSLLAESLILILLRGPHEKTGWIEEAAVLALRFPFYVQQSISLCTSNINRIVNRSAFKLGKRCPDERRIP